MPFLISLRKNVFTVSKKTGAHNLLSVDSQEKNKAIRYSCCVSQYVFKRKGAVFKMQEP